MAKNVWSELSKDFGTHCPQQCELLQDQAAPAPGFCFASTNRAELKRERVEFLSDFASENVQRTKLEANFVSRKKKEKNNH